MPRRRSERSKLANSAFQETSSIYLDGKNVLSIVVEIDCVRTLRRCAASWLWWGKRWPRGTWQFRFERTGRPEVKNMLLAPKQFDRVNRDLEIRDLYNSEDAFRLADTYVGAYRARLNANLGFWDRLDGKVDWPADEHGDHPLTESGIGRLSDRRHVPTLRRARLISRYRDGQPSGTSLPDVRGPQPQRRCDGHAVHVVGERRQRATGPRWCRPGNEARDDGVSLPGLSESGSSHVLPHAH